MKFAINTRAWLVAVSGVSDLQIAEPLKVDVEVGLYAIHRPRQSDPSDQQHQQDHIGHSGCDVNHLKTEESQTFICLSNYSVNVQNLTNG